MPPKRREQTDKNKEDDNMPELEEFQAADDNQRRISVQGMVDRIEGQSHGQPVAKRPAVPHGHTPDKDVADLEEASKVMAEGILVYVKAVVSHITQSTNQRNFQHKEPKQGVGSSGARETHRSIPTPPILEERYTSPHRREETVFQKSPANVRGNENGNPRPHLHQLCNKSSEAAIEMSIESPEDEAEQIKHCSQLEELLLWNKILKIGDSPIAHSRKVDKLKVLSESLVSSASKAEKSLERQKYKLEAELKNVINALTSAHGRLQNTGEERYQFDEASNHILQHFKLKENKLSRAIASYRAATVTTPAFSSSFFLLGAFGVVSFKLLAEPFFLAAFF
ncbi:hypothetical protein F511_41070 [Dorcoceras hygrometricum]|uniref:Uncharacterized protein n=1 Tax=Dorcoceras hygrometricum TaxID=472368 RepID=A0A2Z7AZ44_9LAMI|nr:hypothetical protein F511_41070 [Dorcoceras hygrometricum]